MSDDKIAEIMAAKVNKQREALCWYADPSNHFPVHHHSAGHPDPVVVFVKEPPVMIDGGVRAREALWGKP